MAEELENSGFFERRFLPWTLPISPVTIDQ